MILKLFTIIPFHQLNLLVQTDFVVALWTMALQWNFHPYGMRLRDQESERISPFHDLNGFVYHQNWLHNLLIASSIAYWSKHRHPFVWSRRRRHSPVVNRASPNCRKLHRLDGCTTSFSGKCLFFEINECMKNQ
jgi:hypothetical protein